MFRCHLQAQFRSRLRFAVERLREAKPGRAPLAEHSYELQQAKADDLAEPGSASSTNQEIDAITYYKLADAFSRVQKYDEAERLRQRSIWLDATSTGPYILMGKVLEKKGEAELAVRALQHALGMDPNNSVAHHLLGQAYRDMGRNEDAERELQVAQQSQESSGAKTLAGSANRAHFVAEDGVPVCSFARRSTISLGSSCRNTRNAPLVQPKPITFC
jgi:tetratricopeptide (TPR) repeat protein